MRTFCIFLISLLLLGCNQSSDRREFSAFRERVRYVPQDVDSIVGQYNCGFGFEGENFVLFPDSTFRYHYWADVIDPNDPVKDMDGKYFISHDSVVFIFQTYEYSPHSSAETVNHFKNSLFSKIRLSYLSERFSPCYFAKQDNHVFLFRHDQMDELRTDFRQLHKVIKTMRLGTARTVSFQSLMRVSNDNK